jgi:outer membrane protein assembly factor BamB
MDDPTPVSRRRLLAAGALAGTAGVAGCSGIGDIGGDGNGGGVPGEDDDGLAGIGDSGPDPAAWRTAYFDNANTSYHPTAELPRDSVTEQWRIDTDENGTPTSPIAADGTVYLGGSSDRPIMFVDIETGEVEWSGPSDEMSSTRSDPVVTDELLHYTDNVYLYTFDLTGAMLERVDVDPAPLGTGSMTVTDGIGYVAREDATNKIGIIGYDLDEKEPVFTYEEDQASGPPAVDDGQLLVRDRGAQKGVTAVSMETGERAWVTEFEGSLSHTIVVGDELAYIAGNKNPGGFGNFVGGFVNAYDTATGDRKWEVKGPGGGTQSNVVFAEGIVYAGFEYEDGSPNVFALDAETGEAVWKEPVGDQPYNLAMAGETLVIGDQYDAIVYALDATTGEKLWSFDTEEGIRKPITVVDGTILVGDNGGTYYAIGGT